MLKSELSSCRSKVVGDRESHTRKSSSIALLNILNERLVNNAPDLMGAQELMMIEELK
jgi:hypothetical protein